MGSELCPESGGQGGTGHTWLFIRVLLKHQRQEPSPEPRGQVTNYKFSVHHSRAVSWRAERRERWR